MKWRGQSGPGGLDESTQMLEFKFGISLCHTDCSIEKLFKGISSHFRNKLTWLLGMQMEQTFNLWAYLGCRGHLYESVRPAAWLADGWPTSLSGICKLLKQSTQTSTEARMAPGIVYSGVQTAGKLCTVRTALLSLVQTVPSKVHGCDV